MALAEWTVLVLLSQRPAHGFAVSLLTAPDGELGRIWRIPRPVVYRAIGRLLDAGFITPESVEPGLGPQRTIYNVTPQGRDEAERWRASEYHQPRCSLRQDATDGARHRPGRRGDLRGTGKCPRPLA